MLCYVCMSVCVYAYVYVYVYAYVYVYIYVCVCVCMYVFIYIHQPQKGRKVFKSIKSQFRRDELRFYLFVTANVNKV